jgi:hypothetical protein
MDIDTLMYDSNKISKFQETNCENDFFEKKNQMILMQEEIKNLQKTNKKLINQNNQLKSKNAKLQMMKLEIIYKMKNLRNIQMDSELSKKYEQELEDLDIIIEDSELFLESIISNKESSKQMFLNNSITSRTTNEDLPVSHISNKKFEAVIEKLKELNYFGLDQDKINQLNEKLLNLNKPVEFLLILIDSIEEGLEDLNNKFSFLIEKNGKAIFEKFELIFRANFNKA